MKCFSTVLITLRVMRSRKASFIPTLISVPLTRTLFSIPQTHHSESDEYCTPSDAIQKTSLIPTSIYFLHLCSFLDPPSPSLGE